MTDPQQLPEWAELATVLDETPVPCRLSPETWYADDLDERALAIEACTDCPALVACGRYADAADDSTAYGRGSTGNAAPTKRAAS